MEGGDSLEVIGGKKCVICVGSTGAGKSTLIKKMTGEEVKTSSGVESTTTMTELFKEKSWIPLSEEEYYYWVDTQGWEDSEGEKDYYIFKNIFNFLKEEKMTEIQGIIWNVNSNEKASATLQRQAQLIQQFSSDGSNIWERVLIVCKKMHEKEIQVQGAKEAAVRVQNNEIKQGNLLKLVEPAKILSTGFTIMEDPHVQEKLKEYSKNEGRGKKKIGGHRNKCPRSTDAAHEHPKAPTLDTSFRKYNHDLKPFEFCNDCGVTEIPFQDCATEACQIRCETLYDECNVWPDSKVRKTIKDILKNFDPIPIQYKPQQCKACGEKNDARLMSNKCHTNSIWTHGPLQRRHKNEGKKFHTGREPPYHRVEGIPKFNGTYFPCCGKNEWSFKDKLLKKSGCQKVWSCCQEKKESEGCHQELLFDCCEKSTPKHRSAPEMRHLPMTRFRYPGHVANPGNWFASYRHVCDHKYNDPAFPGCKKFYPCCNRFEDDPLGGCELEATEGCQVYCTWCDKDPTKYEEGCRQICVTCEKEWGKAEGCTYLPDMTPHKEVVSSDRMWTVRNPTIRGDPYRAFNDIGVVPASKELQSSITDPTGFIHSIIEGMRQVKGEERKWRGYTPGEVRTMITGKLEEMIEADLITWHEDEQTPEDWVQVMTTMDEKGNFPSCDPLFATLTAEVLERDIVIVQADVGPNAPWENRYHVIKAKVLDKKSRNSSPSLTQRLRGGSSTEKYASNALFLSLNERQVDGEGIQHRFGCLRVNKDALLLKHLAGKNAPFPRKEL